MAEVLTRFQNAWNAFLGRAPTQQYSQWNNWNGGFSYRPDRTKLNITNERSIVASIYNRIAIDVAAVQILHVRTDDNNRYMETIASGLNNCLTLMQTWIKQVEPLYRILLCLCLMRAV